jgi:uncharacterized protein (DUF1697 family)
METYISMLRGINVNGKNIIKMDALKKLFEDLNFQKVSTYVQSGNVVFGAIQTDVKKLEDVIHSQIISEFGLDVPVIVLTIQTLKLIIDQNPFVKEKDKAFLHFTFLSESIINFNKELVESKKTNEEDICIIENVVYLYCPNGYGKSKLSNTFLENKLKVTATTRNWKTTTELLRIAEQIFC